MKPDEYERARSVICRAFDVDYCQYCPLYAVDNCYEQTDEAEKILLKLFGICPKGYEEEEKEECRSDVAAKNRVDTIIKGLREVQAYCASQKRGCRGCALWDSWGGCKLGSCPVDWDLDDICDSAADTSTSGKGA